MPSGIKLSPQEVAAVITFVLAVPLLVAATAYFMGWTYRRALGRSVPPAGPPPDQADDKPEPELLGRVEGGPRLCLVGVDAASVELGPAAQRALKDARDATNSARVAYVAAALLYAAMASVLFVASTAKLPLGSRVILPYLILAPQLVIVTWFINLPRRQRLGVFFAYSLAGVCLVPLAPGAHPLLVVLILLGYFVLAPLAGLRILLARRMQPFLVLLAASLLYIGAWMIALYLILSHPAEEAVIAVRDKPWLLAVGAVNIVLSVFVAGTLLTRRRTVKVLGTAALAVVALAGSGLLFPAHVLLWVLSGAATSILGVLLVWLIFKLLVWLHERQRWLTPEILDAHFCWTYLTLYLIVWAWGMKQIAFNDSGRLGWGLLLGLTFYLGALHTLLLRARARRAKRASRRLLLLRVFGQADEREDLLDALGDTWRRIGAVDLTAGTDVASRTLRSSMLEMFLLRRSVDQFLKTDAEVDKRLARLRSEIEGDARYPVNGVYCYENVWQRAFVRLVQEAAAVLMDLRGFTADNKGCVWELHYLVQHTPLRRVLLLVDRGTKLEAIETVTRAAWARLPEGSPNAGDPEPELKLLSFDRRSEAEKQALFKLLLSAASDASATA